MVITGYWQGVPVTMSFKSNSTTISLGDPDDATVFSYDLAGRLWSVFEDGVSYRRGLNGRMLAKWRDAGAERERRWLEPEAAQQIEARAYHTITALFDAFDQGQVDRAAPLPAQAISIFAQIRKFDAAQSAADAAQYQAVYQPVGILPPDQYLSLVLQLTEGCSFNTCTFCTFYKERVFHIKTPDELRHHAATVRDFLGDGLHLRRSIFLGDANALVVPMPRLLPLIEVVHEVFDVQAMGGLYAFLDAFSGEKKSAADYAVLKARGLKRVYIGLESGSAALLDFLKKPGQPQDAVETVQHIKAGGVAVSVIVLLGAGGQHYADQHVAETIQVLNAMPLDAADLIYFSNLVVSETMPYAAEAARLHLQPLTLAACQAQGDQIRAGLRHAPRSMPKISRYDIREFVY